MSFQGPECSYAELAFPTSSEKALLVHNNDNYQGTEYAHIVTSNKVGGEMSANTSYSTSGITTAEKVKTVF